MTGGLRDSPVTDWKKGCETTKRTLPLTLLSSAIPQTGIPTRHCSTKLNAAEVLRWAGQQEKDRGAGLWLGAISRELMEPCIYQNRFQQFTEVHVRKE